VNVPEQLAALGIPPECIENRSSAQEKTRRFSIRPKPGDQIWRIRVDGCWLVGTTRKRVDYVFWCQSASGQRAVLLIELKGKNFGAALEQMDSTLELLCKQSGRNIVHRDAHPGALAHKPINEGGVRAFVILSKGTGVPRRSKERLAIQKKYGVIVHSCTRQERIDGLDSLFR
jgi:hypothetical protein